MYRPDIDDHRNDLVAEMEVLENNFPYNNQEENTMGNQDVEMNDLIDDEDAAKSEVTFSFKVENVSTLESQYSPARYARCLPWKIMALKRHSSTEKVHNPGLGFFLQCNGDDEKNQSWSCNAVADLRLLPQKPGVEPYSKKIHHVFYQKENDWGFSHFISFSDLLDPDKGYVKDDSIILEVRVKAEAPHGVSWDSKKHTGFVGLKNQGATCYMNSLLQTLYFTNQLRKAVYKMPTESDDSNKSVALALQRVFHELQFNEKPVGTKKLTKSFGWEDLDSFMQHDVQEFLRVLLDKLEIKMKGTCVEGTVPKLFEGKMLSFIKCKNINYESSRAETFYDIQLNVKGKKDILESFKDYVEPEVLDGDNKYDAGEHGFQDAIKGVTFKTLPPVLHLHLMRFQYDPVTDCSVKFNDRFEFYDKINLDEYLKQKEDTPANYILHAVLVHSGDNHGGHYVVYINPKGDGKWCKFDDDVVSKCNKDEAINNNFGGNDEDNIPVKQSANAYMLVYIRESELKNVLEEVTGDDIPEALEERLKEEKNLEGIKRKEKAENYLYMQVNVLLEEMFEAYQGSDLCDTEKCTPRIFKVRKSTPIDSLVKQIADALGYSTDSIRLWPFVSKPNDKYRPELLNVKEQDIAQRMTTDVALNSNPWIVWVETIPAENNGQLSLPPHEHNLFFFKLYDPKRAQLYYCGHDFVSCNSSVDNLVLLLNQKAGFPLDTKLLIYKEDKPNNPKVNLIKLINMSERTVGDALKNVMDGDILVFQKEEYSNQFMTADQYFIELFHRIEVTFCDKTLPADPGFTLEISENMLYDDLLKLLGQHLNCDRNRLQLYQPQPYKDGPGCSVPPSFDGTVKDILSNIKSKTCRKIYYQQLSISLNELVNKKSLKISWLGLKSKEEKEVTVYVNKRSDLTELFECVKKDPSIEIVGPEQGGSGQLRLLEINTNMCRINRELAPESYVETLDRTNNFPIRNYRLEEIPLDEVDLADDEMLIPVAHYNRDLASSFGTPILLKVKNGEKFFKVKERLVKKLNIPEKEFEKFKFSLVSGQKISSIDDDNDFIVNLQHFKINHSPYQEFKVWLGLDHVNKAASKRSRINYLEKAIKIYN